MTTLTVADLTDATLSGNGVFDILMRANKAHLDAEFAKDRIKGAEYSTVYLGSLTQVMQTALQFVLTKEKINLEAELLEQQILLAQVEVLKANAAVLQIQAQTALAEQQTQNALAELAIIQANALKVPVEILHIEAQTSMIGQQKLKIQDDLITSAAQRLKLVEEKALVIAQTAIATQQKLNLVSELETSIIQRDKLTQEIENLESAKLQSDAQTLMLGQQKTNLEATALNIPKEGEVLVAQKCKLQAEFDLLVNGVLKSNQEIALLSQKVATERAQVAQLGVDPDSVIGRQKALYAAQTGGFARDAEQKAADLMVKAWNVQRTTSTDDTPANSTNRLNDVNIGAAVSKLLSGVGAA